VAAGSSAVVDVQDPYVAAARALLQVSDVGLTEVVRHVGTTSVVAASLLDNLRAVLTDVASNCIDYVTVAKRHVLDQRAQGEQMLSQLLALQERLTASCAERDDLQQQLDEADDECARLRDEASRRDDAEERAALLSVLEETAQQRTSALEELHASITGTITGAKTIKDNPVSNLDGGGNSPSMSGPPSPQAGDSVPPSRAVSPTRKNSRARGQRRSSLGGLRQGGMSTSGIADDLVVDPALYEALVPFLSSLHATVTATDAACRPFYSRLYLNQPELSVAVASSRWAAIANVVGAFEASAERKGSAVDTAKAAEAELARHVAATRTGRPRAVAYHHPRRRGARAARDGVDDERGAGAPRRPRIERGAEACVAARADAAVLSRRTVPAVPPYADRRDRRPQEERPRRGRDRARSGSAAAAHTRGGGGAHRGVEP
jgi:hypothetical protein